MNMSSQLQSNIVNLVQTHWADVLNSDPVLARVCKVVPENIRDIDFEIRNALQKQGIAGVVMTPSLAYRGRDDKATYWDVNGMEISFTENPIVNRASSKPASSWASAQDCACRAAQVLAGPAFPSKSDCVVKRQETGEYQGLLVSKLTVDCFAELHSEPSVDFMQAELTGGSIFELKISRFKSEEDTPIQMQAYDRGSGIAGEWKDIPAYVNAIRLNGDQCLRFRAKPGMTVDQPLSSYFSLAKEDGDANIKISGNLMKLVTLDDSPDANKIGANVFSGFFKDWTWLEDAGDAFAGDSETALEDYAFKEAFSGCSSLKRAPKIAAGLMSYDHIFQDMYQGCSALEEIHWASSLGPSENDWEKQYPGAPRFGAPKSAKVIYDL